MRSGQVVDNAQVDLTKQAARYNMELPSLPANPAPAPKSNVAILVENREAAVEERRDTTLPPFPRDESPTHMACYCIGTGMA